MNRTEQRLKDIVIPEVKSNLSLLNHGVDGQPVELVRQIRTYKLITPLFGGGVNPGEPDPSRLISGKAVRGQLRFWWRATRGGEFGGDLKRLKQAESRVWGTSALEVKKKDSDELVNEPFPSQVQIVVAIDKPVNKQSGREFPFEPYPNSQGGGSKLRTRAGSKIPPYAAFPLQPDQNELKKPPNQVGMKPVQTGVEFTMAISFPKNLIPDVEAALWAWETFGGVGARTRRGFGAIKQTSKDGVETMPLPPDKSSIRERIEKELKRHVSEGVWPPEVSHLSPDTDFVVRPVGKDEIVWQELVNKLKDFRQDRPENKYKDPVTGKVRAKPGRSRWPEPDEIRRRTGRRSNRHSQILSSVRKFPRADFGLPIIFQFKPDEKKGDPFPTTLEGATKDKTRLASPLILRPLACGQNQAVGLAVILDGPRARDLPGGLILKGAANDPPVSSDLSDLTDDELSSIAPLDGKEDVLDAFLDYLIR